MQTKRLKTYFELPSTASKKEKLVESYYGHCVKALGGRKISLIKKTDAAQYQVNITPTGKKRAASIALLIASTVFTFGLLPSVAALLHYRASKNYFAAYDSSFPGTAKVNNLPSVEQIKQNHAAVMADIENISAVKDRDVDGTIRPADIVQRVERLKADRLTPEQIAAVAQRPELAHLRKDLAITLDDIEWVDKVLYFYAMLLRNKIPQGQRSAFEGWMRDNAFFIGSPYFNHNLFFEQQSEQKNTYFTSDATFKLAFRGFVRAVQHYTTTPNTTEESSSDPNNIAILYPGVGGGGHKAPAQAMEKHLKAMGYKVKMIDVSEYERPYDPKIEGMTRDEIYTRVYQQAGDIEKACRMWNEGRDLQPLESRRFMADITNDLREFKAGRVFVVAHHMPKLAYQAYKLGVPATYVHTDHEFHHNLRDLAHKQARFEDPLIQFTALSDNSDFFHYLLDNGQKCYTDLPKPVRKQMVRLNFPVRPAFQAVTKAEKVKVREELGIDENAIVVKVAMGSNGIPKEIKDIIARIKRNAATSDKPLHVLVVCGTNTSLKDELDAMEGLQGTAGVSFRVLGFLNETEMSNYDKSSDVWITKPGGSTSAEAAMMRKQMIYVPTPHHDWELKNAGDLERKQLAEAITSRDADLVAQIVARARIGEDVEYIQSNEDGWRDQLEHIVYGDAEPLLEATA